MALFSQSALCKYMLCVYILIGEDKMSLYALAWLLCDQKLILETQNKLWVLVSRSHCCTESFALGYEHSTCAAGQREGAGGVGSNSSRVCEACDPVTPALRGLQPEIKGEPVRTDVCLCRKTVWHQPSPYATCPQSL